MDAVIILAAAAESIRRDGVERVVHVPVPYVAQAVRNDPCPCGSRQKYKKCCRPNDRTKTTAKTVRVPYRTTLPNA